MGRGGEVSNFRAAWIFFPCRNFFFRMHELFSGPLAVHEFFFIQSSLACIFFVLRSPSPPFHGFSNGRSFSWTVAYLDMSLRRFCQKSAMKLITLYCCIKDHRSDLCRQVDFIFWFSQMRSCYWQKNYNAISLSDFLIGWKCDKRPQKKRYQNSKTEASDHSKTDTIPEDNQSH